MKSFSAARYFNVLYFKIKQNRREEEAAKKVNSMKRVTLAGCISSKLFGDYSNFLPKARAK
tara:strand:- start:681 stop:863 length:183 start_codon:yes stop_codon:yes gene_type:complete